jgi:hypothetical protein
MDIAIAPATSVKRRTFFILFAFLTGINVLLPAYANTLTENPKILILKSNNSALYNKLASELVFTLGIQCKNCPEKPLLINTDTISEPSSDRTNSKYSNYDFIITLGKKAWLKTEALNLGEKIKTLHAVLPLDQLIINAKPNQYFLVLEQSYEKQLRILSDLLYEHPNISVIYSNDSAWRKALIENASENISITTDFRKIEPLDYSSISKLLNQKKIKANNILMLPDKQLYNRNNISQILLSGYANNITFIGYSISLAKTGALASIITPQNDIASDISKLSYEILDQKKMPGIYYPSSYKVFINQSILETLNISIKKDFFDTHPVEVIQ